MTDTRFNAAAIAAPATLALLVGASTYVTQRATPETTAAGVTTSADAVDASVQVTRDGPRDAVVVAMDRAIRAQDRQVAALRRRLDDLKAQTRAARQGAVSTVSSGSSGTWTAPVAGAPSISTPTQSTQTTTVTQSTAPATQTTTGASGVPVP
ncbi:MAG: hypothetical protein WAN48_05925 [Actinomycetes bacterium]